MLLGLMRQYRTRMESLVSVGGQRYVRARVRRRYPEMLAGVSGEREAGRGIYLEISGKLKPSDIIQVSTKTKGHSWRWMC